jgi:SAM-dependent methyltransferase
VAGSTLPYPPLELADRVGSLAGADDPLEYYDKLGRETRDGLVARLPADWTFAGRRILDFGCGAGRTLRQFSQEATDAEFWGCDIDAASIRWVEEELSPPFRVFVNNPEPPLAHAAASFDMIWAVSVFTHIAADWSDWLAELHRVLKPNGLLLATFMGRGMSEEIANEPWDESRFGMNVIKYGQSWDLGGPMVLHSPWWIEEHWGRAFDVVSLTEDGFGNKPWLDHGVVLMRKRGETVDPAELESIDAADPREARALAHNVQQLLAECLDLRTGLGYFDSKLNESAQQNAQLQTDLGRVQGDLANMRGELDRVLGEAVVLHRETALAQKRAAQEREHSLEGAQRLMLVEERLAQSRARAVALEEAVDALQQRQEHVDRVMQSLQTSVSWRITAPLRALKRLTR